MRTRMLALDDAAQRTQRESMMCMPRIDVEKWLLLRSASHDEKVNSLVLQEKRDMVGRSMRLVDFVITVGTGAMK